MKKKKAHGSYNLFDIVKEITIAFRTEFLFFSFLFLMMLKMVLSKKENE